MSKSTYYKFSEYLKERFGCRVYKVSIDAGFSCPNKDGKLSKDGCVYCDNKAFSLNSRTPSKPIETQIENGIAFSRQRYGAKKFIVYFQAYTNTYLPQTDMPTKGLMAGLPAQGFVTGLPASALVAGATLDILKERYDVVRKFKDVVGISIGTRPDCVNEEILDLINSYSKDYEVWLEYGLQSIHDKTLKLINRRHTYEDFFKAVDMTRKRNIKICAHIIIGLPNETKEEMMETAKALAKLKIDGVKIHPLHIVKGTKLEEIFKKGKYKPLELDEYVNIVTEFLQYLPPTTVIQRITADCPKEFLVAPEWILNKQLVLNMIDKRIEEKNTYQSKHFVDPIEMAQIRSDKKLAEKLKAGHNQAKTMKGRFIK
ncbi:TIGR01212 family radical SAM protein [bacterium]|nr:TIGR01212 family radical SAM protein [bacterium]